ncbi:hypothetical protein [Paenibacillus sp. JJ-100]|uniref:hypothetical protein n=1 Tax=Paenibacillus sp. JJ-100 TaxID=2974896 RepID=UPI00232BA102|nr:hypothetical protein [Paenibacillus sp. JJ-100]
MNKEETKDPLTAVITKMVEDDGRFYIHVISPIFGKETLEDSFTLVPKTFKRIITSTYLDLD